MLNLFKRIAFNSICVAGAFAALALISHAEEMPTGVIPLKIDFTQSTGFFNHFTSEFIPETAAQAISNIDLNRTKNLTPRRGVRKLVDIGQNTVGGTTEGESLFIYVSTNNVQYFMLRTGLRLYAIPYPNLSFTGGTVNKFQEFSTNTLSGQVDGVNWNGVFYLVNEDTSILKITESVPNGYLLLSTPTSTPNGKYGSPFLDRLIVSGNSMNPLRVFYSQADAPESFPISNYFDITGVKIADKITGIGPTLLGQKPLYTDNTTRVITGTVFPSSGTGGNIDVRVISENIGCVHHRTIQNMPNNEQYFFSRGPNGTAPGIYSLNGISVNEKTESIRNYFIDVVSAPIVSANTILPSAYVDENGYCLNVATQGGAYNTATICLDRNDRPTIYERTQSTADLTSHLSIDMVVASHVNGKMFATSGHTSNAYRANIYSYDVGQDEFNGNGNTDQRSIPWRYKTKDFDMGQSGDRNRPKQPIRAYLSYDFVPTTFSLTVNYDFGRSSYTFNFNSTTSYNSSSMKTIIYSSSVITTKLVFPQATAERDFKRVNFDFQGSSYTSIRSLDFYAIPKVLD